MLTLTPAELVDLTGKERPAAQKRALDFLGVPYRQRLDRSLAVLRSAAEAALGGAATMHSSQREPELHP